MALLNRFQLKDRMIKKYTFRAGSKEPFRPKAKVRQLLRPRESAIKNGLQTQWPGFVIPGPAPGFRSCESIFVRPADRLSLQLSPQDLPGGAD